MRFQAPGGVIVPAPKAHTRAMSVCSAVRSVLVAEPRRRTCSNDAAYVALATDGGAAGRNCDGDDSPKGVHEAICANAPGKYAGAVGRHCPGSVPGVTGVDVVAPSAAR